LSAFVVAKDTIKLHGAYGLTEEYLVGRLFRDARCLLIGGGSNEVLGTNLAYYMLENYKKWGELQTTALHKI
jgi:alkylation response protein AidB-like acyl-CoA dehydrogenase